MMSPGRIVLASASPRRRDLLQAIGCEFIVDASDIDETEHAGEDPVAYVQRVAIGKARAFHALPDDLIIAADTTVDVDGRILAKPVDADDARRMLALLNGRTHLVHSAIAVRFANTCEFGVETTAVTFRSLSSVNIDWYVGTGEPFGKAGAYALQGAGGFLVEAVSGSVSNVIGMSYALLDELVRRAGLAGLIELDQIS